MHTGFQLLNIILFVNNYTPPLPSPPKQKALQAMLSLHPASNIKTQGYLNIRSHAGFH